MPIDTVLWGRRAFAWKGCVACANSGCSTNACCLQQLHGYQQRTREELEQLQQHLQALCEQRPESGTIAAQELQQVWFRRQVLELQMQRHHEQQQRLREMEAAQRSRVQQALQEERILELLKQRYTQLQQTEERRREQRALDELAQRRRER